MGASKPRASDPHPEKSDRQLRSATTHHDPRRAEVRGTPHPKHARPEPNRLTVKIGGEAGFGIATSGLLLTKTLLRAGLSVLDYTEYPSLIRGGHNVFLLRVAEEEVRAPLSEVNVLIALNKATAVLHEHELGARGAVLYDRDEMDLGDGTLKRDDLELIGVPFETLAAEAAGNKLMRNTVALGAFLGVVGCPCGLIEGVITEVFAGKGKGSEVAKRNIAAARAGHAFVLDNFPEQERFVIKPRKAKDRIAVTGAEAVALGAVAAGCQLYAAYPMTPASPVLHYLAAKQEETGMVVRHPEDEIAAVNLAIGAAFAGVRAMTGSSGGGFSLMVESLGLAAVTETPLVILEAMRPGPATGLPTWTGQEDLRFLIHAAQGEFPRVILAPGDVEESFRFTFEAFNLAERFQIPVFVLTDKYLNESHFTAKPFSTDGLRIDRGKLATAAQLKKLTRRFKRYEFTGDGISPRSIPGQPNGIFMANSDEHDEFGYTTEDSLMRRNMTKKRFAKLDAIERAVPSVNLHGPKGAPLTVIGWGSTKGSILTALDHLKHDGITANFLQVTVPWPFPTKQVRTALENAERTLLVEQNATAQLGGLVREYTGIESPDRLLKFDGRPVYPEEIVQRAKEVLGG